jgi:hypothetical protein
MSTGGVISGTPSTSGSFSVTIRLQDSRGSSSQVSKTLSLSVAASAPENETTYPHPSGTWVRSANLNLNGTSDGFTINNPGLYGFYVAINDATYWHVFRISGTLDVQININGNYFGDVIVRDNSTVIFSYAEAAGYLLVSVYYIKD